MKNHKVPSDYVSVRAVSGVVVPVKQTKRGFRFANEQVRVLKSGQVLYLRSRYDLAADTVVHSLRTQSHGKGVEVARCKAVPVSQAGSALSRLYARKPFEYVLYVPYFEWTEGD